MNRINLTSETGKNSSKRKHRVGIIGGGPGGLMTAYLLQQRAGALCDTTIFELRPRFGGKIITRHFDPPGTTYEAGAAELYDYSLVGPDPLRDLVREMGLKTIPMSGRAVVLNNHILRTEEDIRCELGEESVETLRRFHRLARQTIGPWQYYACDWSEESDGPLISESFHSYLSRIRDPRARRYIEVLIHSDMATEAEHTNVMYGLQNYLMNYPEYMRLYSIGGGIERLPQEIGKRLKARILLNRPVVRVEPVAEDRYRIFSRLNGEIVNEDFDFVIVALPVNWLLTIDWAGALEEPMRRHHGYYDDLAHYLRVTVLFKKPFWREKIAESYFMLDAFGGCCVYDESSRNTQPSPYGVLSWLLAGEPALSMSNFDDERLIKTVLESLPPCLGFQREWFVEGRVYRFIGTVSALPGGHHPCDPEARHTPDPDQSNFFIVGDYLFDSTINGVLDSATVVADLLDERFQEEAEAETASLPPFATAESNNGSASAHADAGINRLRESAVAGVDSKPAIPVTAAENQSNGRQEP